MVASSGKRISPVFIGILLVLLCGILSVKVLQPWIATLEQGSGLRSLGGLAVTVLRLGGLAGYGFILYGIVRGIVRLFK